MGGGRTRDQLLNGLLMALVCLSVYLSAKVWFPADQSAILAPREAQVQLPPPAFDRGMPEILRPEHILVRRQDGSQAVLPAGSSAYLGAWRQVREILARARPVNPAEILENQEQEAIAGETITIVLPMTMRLGEWADRWSWANLGTLNPTAQVDRVTLQLSGGTAILLHGMPGSQGRAFRLGPYHEHEQQSLREYIKTIEAGLFITTRALELSDPVVQLAPGLRVANVTAMHAARVRVNKPVEYLEQLRFFPDISVVRQIDERDARSFTDGQRLLRLTKSGILEYRTADATGLIPDLGRSLQTLQDWIAVHGGWPQDLVLTRYVQELGRAKLQFDFRASGYFPIETAGGAMQVDLTAERITRFRRFPEIMEVSFEQHQLRLIPPEEALKVAAQEASVLLFDSVRQVYPAYLFRPGTGTEEPEWVLEPSWVIKVGAARIYVPANYYADRRTITVSR